MNDLKHRLLYFRSLCRPIFPLFAMLECKQNYTHNLYTKQHSSIDIYIYVFSCILCIRDMTGWFLRAPHPLEKLPIFLRLSHSFALSLVPKVFLSAILIEWCDKSSPLYTHRMRPPVVWARTSSSLFSLYILLQWAFKCARERARKSSVFTLWVCRVAARGAWAHSTYRPTYTQMYAITVRQRNGARVGARYTYT